MAEQVARTFNVYAVPRVPIDVPSAPIFLEPAWWSNRWLRYNKYVFLSAFVAVVIGTIVTMIVKWEIGVIFVFALFSVVIGVPYILMANLCYLLGPLGELFLPKPFRSFYRHVAYACGLVLAVFIPAVCTMLCSAAVGMIPNGP